MPNLQEALRSVILRLARREIRAVARPMRKELRALRRKVSGLPKTLAALGRHVADLVRAHHAQRANLQASAEEAQSARFSPGLIQKLRRRLKLTQGQMAQLVGVSVTGVRAWEAGRSRPQAARRSALVALRKMGRREVARLVAVKAAKGPGRRTRKPPRRRRRRAGRGRKAK